MFGFLLRLLLSWVLVLIAGCASHTAAVPTLSVSEPILLGASPALRISGVPSGATVTVHALRLGTRGRLEGRDWVESTVKTHAFATFAADARGEVDIDDVSPIQGSYEGIDPLGLLWSGYLDDAPEALQARGKLVLAPWPNGSDKVQFVLSIGGELVARREANLRDAMDDVVYRAVAVDDPTATGAKAGISGVFAAPGRGEAKGTLILLHGSEGADPAFSRVWAGRMASFGYTALALHYVAYSWSGAIPGVSPTFTNIPIETLDAARRWLGQQPEADLDRLGLLGISKGAELALVAAVRYPWVRSVVPTPGRWEHKRPASGASPHQENGSRRGPGKVIHCPLFPTSATTTFSQARPRPPRCTIGLAPP